MSISLVDLCAEDSDSDDQEYIPDGRASSGESESGSDEMEPSSPSKDGGQMTKKKRKGKKPRFRRKRGGGPLEEGGVEGREEEEREDAAVSKEEEDKKERAKIDDLWASFKQETASVHKGKEASVVSDSQAGPPPKKVKIQQTYDFAGEEVTVEKVVDVDSVEAVKFLKSESEEQPKSKTSSTLDSSSKTEGSESVTEEARATGIGPSSVGKTFAPVEKVVDVDSVEAVKFLKSESEEQPKSKTSSTLDSSSKTEGSESVTEEARATGIGPSSVGKTFAPPKVRSSGLSSVLSTIGKKPKMSTLEKSSLDWSQYKDDHGLKDELARHSKDGYLGKLDFLHRADLRQFELERELRLKRFKKNI